MDRFGSLLMTRKSSAPHSLGDTRFIDGRKLFYFPDHATTMKRDSSKAIITICSTPSVGNITILTYTLPAIRSNRRLLLKKRVLSSCGFMHCLRCGYGFLADDGFVVRRLFPFFFSSPITNNLLLSQHFLTVQISLSYRFGYPYHTQRSRDLHGSWQRDFVSHTHKNRLDRSRYWACSGRGRYLPPMANQGTTQ
jgi:hypothetical protein